MGVLETGTGNRVLRFWEKPENPRPVQNQPDRALVNMGVYLFETAMLLDVLYKDALRRSSHDFGRDILPCLVDKGQVYAHPFYDKTRKTYNYWRDIGTLDSYHEASMDLVAARPPFNLHKLSFPIHSFAEVRPPARLAASRGLPGRKAVGHNSLICNGCVIRGGRVERSILSPNVRVNSHALVEDSILFDGVEIGSRAKIRRAIIDKDVRIPPRFHVGYDLGVRPRIAV